jgi:hypothetical protein
MIAPAPAPINAPVAAPRCVLGPAGDAQFESPTAQTAAIMERYTVFMMLSSLLIPLSHGLEMIPTPLEHYPETRLARKTFKKY